MGKKSRERMTGMSEEERIDMSGKKHIASVINNINTVTLLQIIKDEKMLEEVE